MKILLKGMIGSATLIIVLLLALFAAGLLVHISEALFTVAAVTAIFMLFVRLKY